jgi:4a-hydroxytetrahydrobiopterin dehydratase
MAEATSRKTMPPSAKSHDTVMPALTATQVRLHLKAVPNWTKRAQTISRTFKFEDFLKSIAFVNRIARKAQKLNHHPDIDIRFNKVTLNLTTHDEGGLTKKDFSLARQCDEVFLKF